MPDLLIVGDSLAFHGPDRPYPADEPRLWPNIAAARLGGTAELVARAGWTARHAWAAITGDPRVWAALPRVDAVVLGVSGMDSLPSPLPTALRELIPALRPAPLRRVVRAGYRRAQPVLSRSLARLPGGGPEPETVFAINHLDPHLQAALDELPPDFRVAVVLCDVEGLSYEEIGATLDVKLGTVRSRIHRGRTALRASLERHRAAAAAAERDEVVAGDRGPVAELVP